MDTSPLPEYPRCGRRDKVVRKAVMLNGAASFLFLLGFIIPLIPWIAIPFVLTAASRAKRDGTWQCRACQHVWSQQ